MNQNEKFEATTTENADKNEREQQQTIEKWVTPGRI